ncbi:hypothetical protein BD626DRAFT_147847 [Schizophyllum amplum]|uniref:Uncharacterized protein n=1 Tax=Schizophyllum amplum TaxID=97359 RepID=A0A550C4N1_9AGAR|nr:hypothetical protein BD626DRAFT_147847 [Auriculariopsis ampla]
MLAMFVFISQLIRSDLQSAGNANAAWAWREHASPRSPSERSTRTMRDDVLEARSKAPPCSTTRVSQWGSALRGRLQRPRRLSCVGLRGVLSRGRVRYELSAKGLVRARALDTSPACKSNMPSPADARQGLPYSSDARRRRCAAIGDSRNPGVR